VVAKPQSQEPESPVAWLESELRESKARLHKVESELEQALKQVWSMEGDIRRLMEAVSVTGSATSALSTVREDVRQLHGQMGKLEDRQSALANRADEVVRQRQAETGRDRQDLAALTKQIETLARNTGQYEGRMQALEETTRHIEEGVAGERLSNQGLGRSLEELSTRTARSHEATLRIDQEVAHAAIEIARLAKEGTVFDERQALVNEQVRHLADRIGKLEDVAAFPEEARELLKRATVERDQLTNRMGVIEQLSSEVSERLQEFLQGVARLDQRSVTHGGQLMAMSEQLKEVDEQTKAQLKRVFQTLLRQRRRQAETLAQEIKELGQGELHSGG
jgi:chromosome segregation ATPase